MANDCHRRVGKGSKSTPTRVQATDLPSAASLQSLCFRKRKKQKEKTSGKSLLAEMISQSTMSLC